MSYEIGQTKWICRDLGIFPENQPPVTCQKWASCPFGAKKAKSPSNAAKHEPKGRRALRAKSFGAPDAQGDLLALGVHVPKLGLDVRRFLSRFLACALDVGKWVCPLLGQPPHKKKWCGCPCDFPLTPAKKQGGLMTSARSAAKSYPVPDPDFPMFCTAQRKAPPSEELTLNQCPILQPCEALDWIALPRKRSKPDGKLGEVSPGFESPRRDSEPIQNGKFLKGVLPSSVNLRYEWVSFLRAPCFCVASRGKPKGKPKTIVCGSQIIETIPNCGKIESGLTQI